MMKITVDMVMDLTPCYSRERVEELADGRESISAMEVLSLPISINDRAWLLSQLLGHRDVTREVARRIVRDVTSENAIPDACRSWLDSGNEKFQSAAWYAVWGIDTPSLREAVKSAASYLIPEAAMFAAWNSATAAQDRDYAQSGVYKASMEKYTTWMAEWLDSHEEEYDDEDNG